jgi:hypothetical protein
MSLDLTVNHGGGGRGGGARKRRDLDDESAKDVSTSNITNIGNGNGSVYVRNSSTLLY